MNDKFEDAVAEASNMAQKVMGAFWLGRNYAHEEHVKTTAQIQNLIAELNRIQTAMDDEAANG